MRRERREEARYGNEGEELIRKHEGNNTDRGSQRGEHRRNFKDTEGYGKSKQRHKT